MENYINRINSANPIQLISINYEIIIEYIENALDLVEKGENMAPVLLKARELLASLFESLDITSEKTADFSKNMADLYLYVNRLLIQADTLSQKSDKTQALTDAKTLVQGILKAWKTLEPLADKKAPISGLTYTKDGELSEFDNQTPNSDYKV